MEISYDQKKRDDTWLHRGLDFDRAPEVFSGTVLTVEDDRRDYGEVRYQTIGLLDNVVVMVVWTPRIEAHHIISMRKCNDKERQGYYKNVGGP